MKRLKIFIILLIVSLSFQPLKATHIVGGDITAKALGANKFEITLTLFFDCINGNPGAFDPAVAIGIFDKASDVLQDTVMLPFTDSLTLQLGDSCYTPANLCVRKLRYVSQKFIANNPNGLYLSWLRCCRNGALLANVLNAGNSGNVFYTEIPNPALQNSTPVFSSYPDAYMCVNFFNEDIFSATDPEGDSLVYSLSAPLDCSTNGQCGTINPSPGVAPGPYGTIPWQPPYSVVNIMGDPAMAINSQTGILTTNPPSLGVFVFCVKVEEYNRATKIKLGEIRREVQYAVLPCTFTTAGVSGPKTICLGQSTTLSATGGTNYLWNTGQTAPSVAVTPTAVGTHTYVVSAKVGSCSDTASVIITVYSPPLAAITGSTSICAGRNATLIASGGTSYSWIPGGQNTSAIYPSVTGTYSVIVSIGSNCSDTAVVTVTSLNNPSLTILSQTGPLCSGGNDGSAMVAASGGSSPYAFNWSPKGGVNPSATDLRSGAYIVTVTDSNGCTEDEPITIADPAVIPIALPNAFSPNGDGENDVFCIQGGINCVKQSIITIYDRWGKKVYESKDPAFCWEGTYNGEALNTAVFAYTLEYVMIQTNKFVFLKKNVNLIR